MFYILASLLSGILLFLAFPKYDLWWLAWFGMLPLFIAVNRERPACAFLWSWVCGISFFAGIFNWILAVPGYEILHHAILIPYLGLYFGAFGWLFSLLQDKFGAGKAFMAAPFLWVSLEFARSNLSFLALPWALLAHSQYRYPALIQIASLAGAYGVSFLIVAVNSALAAIILPCISHIDKAALRQEIISINQRTALAAITGFLMIFAIGFGYVRTSNQAQGKNIRLAVVQGNIDREKKQDQKKYADLIMQQYTRLTRQAAKDNPKLIVWPEAATPGFLMNNSILMRQLTTLVKQTGKYFLVGSSEHAKFSSDPIDRNKAGNTALFFNPGGKILGQYLKIFLVPFGEYIPYQKSFTWPDFIVPRKEHFEVPGKDYKLFELDDAKFGVVICWEIVFSDLFRAFVKDGADFMLNITNEGWFGPAALYQMVAISVYRAVENGVSLARAANTGVSCFIAGSSPLKD